VLGVLSLALVCIVVKDILMGEMMCYDFLKQLWRSRWWAVNGGLVIDCGGQVRALGGSNACPCYIFRMQFIVFMDFCSFGNIGSL